MRLIRAFLILILLASAIAVFVAGSKTGSAPLPDSFVKIQYWEKWTGNEARQMQLIVDQFNNTVGKEKRIFVEYTSMSQIDQKTLVATAAGVPPDIAGLWTAQLVQFASMDALEPLEDLAAAHGITAAYYKPVYWRSCNYDGHLWGLVSTPAAIVLHYNKEIFEERAAELRAAGYDPLQPPRTLPELDHYAEILTTYETFKGKQRAKSFGTLPLEPGWYVAQFPHWFGGRVFDPATQQLTMTSPQVVAAFDWIASYSRKYGADSIADFRSGLGTFNSAQNPFLTGDVAMVQQGPWMANYIEDLAPRLNRWRVPPEKLAREKNFATLPFGASLGEIKAILGEPSEGLTWDAGTRQITLTFANGKLSGKTMTYLPAQQRRQFTQWGAAPWPSALPNVRFAAHCDFDTLVIPRGSKHKKEAFEFIAFVNRQDVSESLNAMHCKNSPLAKVSQQFIDYHPNPYIQVFEDCANSPDSFATPQIPIWPEVSDELTVASQKCYLLARTPRAAMELAQRRCQEKWDYFRSVQASRRAAEKTRVSPQ